MPRDALSAVPKPVARLLDEPKPSATDTAVPLSVAADRDTPCSKACAPQLAYSEIWMSLGAVGDTHITGAADAAPAPNSETPAATPIPAAATIAVRVIRRPRLEIARIREIVDIRTPSRTKGRSRESAREVTRSRLRNEAFR
ncbi:hypothetical protein GCM10027068_17140 [Prescottella soli]